MRWARWASVEVVLVVVAIFRTVFGFQMTDSALPCKLTMGSGIVLFRTQEVAGLSLRRGDARTIA